MKLSSDGKNKINQQFEKQKSYYLKSLQKQRNKNEEL